MVQVCVYVCQCVYFLSPTRAIKKTRNTSLFSDMDFIIRPTLINKLYLSISLSLSFFLSFSLRLMITI